MMVRELAEREGHTVSQTPSAGLQTPGEGVPLWRAWMYSQGMSPGTIRVYTSYAKTYLKRDPVPTRQTIESQIAAFIGRVSEEKISGTTKALKSLFRFLHQEGYWPNDPTLKVKNLKVHKRTREPATPAQVAAVLQYQTRRKSDGARFRIKFLLLAETGMRREECASIRWVDVKPSVEQGHVIGGQVRVVGKGSKERFIPLSPEITTLLLAYMEQNPTDSPWLFPSRLSNTGYQTAQAFYESLQRACKKLGIEPFAPHQLRHFYATEALNDGAKLHVVSRILGHASTAITADIYAHVGDREKTKEHMEHSPLRKLMPKQLTGGWIG